MDFTNLTDTELLVFVRARGNLTCLETEMACRLERALDEFESYIRCQVRKAYPDTPAEES